MKALARYQIILLGEQRHTGVLELTALELMLLFLSCFMFACRSSSMVDIAAAPMSPPLSELNPVQRSSSLRVSRLRSPEKCESLRCKVERRKTCIQFIDMMPAADTGDNLQQVGMTDYNDDANDVEISEDEMQSGVCVIRVGSDDIEIEEGKVKRTMRGKCLQ